MREQVLLRVGVWPAHCAATVQAITAHAHHRQVTAAVTAHALNGIIYIQVTGDFQQIAAFHSDLAAAFPHTHLLAAPPDFIPHAERWGHLPAARDQMRAIKVAIDPHNQMNPEAFWFADNRL
jgi:D-lactate dehydrogenase (cytochrome)